MVIVVSDALSSILRRSKLPKFSKSRFPYNALSVGERSTSVLHLNTIAMCAKSMEIKETATVCVSAAQKGREGVFQT